MNDVSFIACKYLDYSDKYFSCVKNLISYGEISKVVWFRKNAETDRLCQFCTKRGRINSPIGCLDESQK